MLTITQYAKIMKRSTSTIRGWIKDKLIERKTFAGSLVFTSEDIKKGEKIKKMLSTKRVKAMKWKKERKQ